LGFADAQSKLTTTGAGPINFQGQSPGVRGAWNTNGVINGAYTFWSYERLFEADATQGTTIESDFAPA